MTKAAKTKNNSLFKILLIFFIFSIVTFLASLQAFVNSNYQPIAPDDFIKVKFWKTVFNQKKQRADIFNNCDNYSLDNYFDDSLIYQTNGIKNSVKNISPIKDWLIYSECDDEECLIKAKNINSSQITIIDYYAIINDKNEASITELKIIYHDPLLSRIIFSIPSIKKAFIMDYNYSSLKDNQIIEPYMWHDIYLEPGNKNKVEIIGIRIDKNQQQYILAYSQNRAELFLYKVSSPHLIKASIPKGYTLAEKTDLQNNACIEIKNDSDNSKAFFNIEESKIE